ncbi:spore germination protein [Alicyclobacillus acidiphilus]|uniref:spore germination protein n=1 Tax=Alicyclobacillus acidiphilus TaxID=182455 RepID=UPI0024802183|nr:spore germination protein [Alicyclobacillus acidiphilus]
MSTAKADSLPYRGDINEALSYTSSHLGQSDDFVIRNLQVAGRRCVLLFYVSICKSDVVEKTIQSLLQHHYPKRIRMTFESYVLNHVLTGANPCLTSDLRDTIRPLDTGDLVILIERVSHAIVIPARSVEHRVPEQPTIEASTRGSQISFVEDYQTNLGLIRASLACPSLTVKEYRLGARSERTVAMVYLRDIANPSLVSSIDQRILQVNIDLINGSATVEQMLSEHPWNPFPVSRVTQRIDTVTREVVQGKVVLIVDGDPCVLLYPATIQDFFQTEEDYTRSTWEATLIRGLRVIALFLSLYLPALYVAFVDFNPELLPKVLGNQIAQSREGVPFSAFVEVVLMQIVVEILREATLRMPRQLGQTLSIVGGLVVGEATVQAGLVSNILIIVVSLTAISFFVIPSYEFTSVLRIGSWIALLASATFGFYGILLVSLWFLHEVVSLRSFGTPYLAPMDGEYLRDFLVDGFVRLPLKLLNKRTQHNKPVDDKG